MRTIEKTVYSFSELSEKAQEKVLYSDLNKFFDDAVIADFKTIAGILGFYDVVPRYSGFCSQGDGASFTGRYSYVKGAAKRLREYAPQDVELHAIADILQKEQARHFYRLRADITLGGSSNHYCHENTVDIHVYDAENEYRDVGGSVVVEATKGLMRRLYSTLEADYFYQTSRENFSELSDANGWEFYEDGAIA